MGILSKAEQLFAKVESLHEHPEESIRCRLNRGYLYFGKGRYSAAYDEFDEVLKKSPSNLTAANNRAICLLYTKNLTKAILSIEEVIRNDPLNTLDETLIFNLCTMYDLEAEDSGKKKNLLKNLILKYGDEDFPFR